jgi:opacity protein-like surface antigen
VGVDLNPAAAGWRFDFEARYRDPLGETATLGGLPVSVRAEQLWSTLVNAYRDLELADTLDLYLTAGIGAGGYQSSYAGGNAIFNVEVAGNRGLSSFAWQAGTGIAWELTERVTFDIGYRFFEVDGGTTTVTATQSGTVLSTTDITSAFSASEVLFSLRIYEPFRSWR